MKKEVQKYIHGYEKHDDVFQLIFSDTEKAIHNNDRLVLWHEKLGVKDILQMEPATQVAELVEKLISGKTVF